ncbi:MULTISPECIES: hypothetical protein [unclassified Thermosynechococcus]|uniref:hypothetical protein n=1 Tax=unclassified Thermosynechococcus TaxID=2622553 RepID=UPI0019825F9E|nr:MULTISPECIES: hypothetical protein [unclassified Thermosynechococcus]MDR5638243.1 hypothetical protein [Thermosynechococcus sp. PP42]MDR7897055.1 hypothetical protein [Thermosynechococcus sp. JY1332]MDR7904453.1 hypothetical protein [Thermosynechococcus sp. JY1334]MDR7920932.1 hypothetical protein [Thermosynechococcus sp. HY213]MDR7992289.1 hypothetical protein [Thermosynechococcus sp. TG252]
MFRTPVALVGAATLSLSLAIAPPSFAEMEVEVARDSRGRVYTVDMDSRRFYRNRNGIIQVDFSLSTLGDDYWHRATASCNPYDVKSDYYGWDWTGTKSYPPGTIAGDIARAVCRR